MSQELVTREQAAALSQPMAAGYLDPITAANYIVKSGLFGSKLSEAEVVVKIMIGAEMGVAPVTAARQIYVFSDSKGRTIIILDATLMAALIKRSGRYDYKIRQHDDQGTVIEFFENGVSLGPPASFTLKDAQEAKLTPKEGPWSIPGYRRDMMFARCMSRGFDHFTPDLGCGLPVMTTEEADTLPMNHDQRKALMAFANEQGMDRDDRLAWSSTVLDRPVESWAEFCERPLTRLEATLLMDARERYAEYLADNDIVRAEILPADAGNGVDSAAEVGDVPQEADAPRGEAPAPAASIPDNPGELATLRKLALSEYQRLSSLLAAEWRPWFRSNVEEIKAGAWEGWPGSFGVAELKELFERLEQVRPWGEKEAQQ